MAVPRIFERHGGCIWATRAVENGANYFYLALLSAGVEAPTGECNVASAQNPGVTD
jgi:hypothetical protein